jgi:hypothetical protein
MKAPYLVIAALAAAAAAGFYAGRATAPPTDGIQTHTAEASGEEPAAATAESSGEADTSPGSRVKQKNTPFTAEEIKAELLLLGSGSMGAIDESRGWADFYARLKTSDVPSLAVAVAAANDEKLESGVRAMYAVWAESDPVGAWNSAQSFSNQGKCHDAMHAVLDTVAKRDPSAALNMAQALENPSLRQHMTTAALHALAKSDPSRAFETALRSATSGDQSSFFSVLSQWVREDHVAAQRAVAKVTGQLGDQARLVLLQLMADKDPEAAWAYAKEFPPPAGRFSYWDPRAQVIGRWSRTDPRKAIDAALTLEDQNIRNRALAEAINSWAGTDFSAALSYAGTVKDGAMRGLMIAALARSQNADPATMFNLLVEQAPAGEAFQNAVSNLMGRWAQTNPREAAAATLQLPAGEALNSAASRLAQEWALSATDKSEVLAWVSQLPEGRARSEAIESVFESWSSRDAEGAQKAWAALAEGNKDEALTSLAAGWSRTKPADAARWAASMVDQPGGRNALDRAVTSWAEASPTEAAAFLESLPQNTRIGLASRLVERWYDADPFAAAEWLKRQPPGPTRDEGVLAMAMEISRENPEAALGWTKTASSAESRASTEKNILRNWMRNDAVSATAWIRTAQLPPETKAEFLGGAR